MPWASLTSTMPTKSRFPLTFPMRTWSVQAAHVREAFQPSWGHIALPAQQTKRSRTDRQNIGVTATAPHSAPTLAKLFGTAATLRASIENLVPAGKPRVIGVDEMLGADARQGSLDPGGRRSTLSAIRSYGRSIGRFQFLCLAKGEGASQSHTLPIALEALKSSLPLMMSTSFF